MDFEGLSIACCLSCWNVIKTGKEIYYIVCMNNTAMNKAVMSVFVVWNMSVLILSLMSYSFHGTGPTSNAAVPTWCQKPQAHGLREQGLWLPADLSWARRRTLLQDGHWYRLRKECWRVKKDHNRKNHASVEEHSTSTLFFFCLLSHLWV